MRRLILIAAMLFSPLFAATAQAASGPAPGQCVVFEHSNYDGAAVAIAQGEPVAWVGNGWNDRISSVLCAPLCLLEAWEHRDFGGKRERFAGATAYVGDRWNDRISSMKVRCAGGDGGHGPDTTRLCVAYEHRDFAGKSRGLPAGEAIRSLGGAWNDRISSFKCAPGCAVTAFEHDGFDGASRQFSGRVDYVGNSWNDRISSVIVQCLR